jgi:hypothetical protein
MLEDHSMAEQKILYLSRADVEIVSFSAWQWTIWLSPRRSTNRQQRRDWGPGLPYDERLI